MAEPSKLAERGGRTAILIRCHFVDAALRALGHRLGASGDYEVIYAIDARSGVTEIDDFKVLSFSKAAFAELGLFTNDPELLWKCGDYVMYLARRRFADYARFWMIEYDVLINAAEPLRFFEEVDRACQSDFVSSYFRAAKPSWHWYKTVSADHETVFACFFPLVRFSSRAIDLLWRERKRATASLIDMKSAAASWPNDEAFVATTLKAHGFACSDLNDVGRYYNEQSFGYVSVWHPRQIEPRDGLLYHPVRRGPGYLKAAAKHNRIDVPFVSSQIGVDWSDEEALDALVLGLVKTMHGIGDNPGRILHADAPISTLLRDVPGEAVVKAALRALAITRQTLCIEALRESIIAAGGPTPRLLFNLALGQPAKQSSTCKSSRSRDPRLDAESANNGATDIDLAFHTDTELNPWWQVDFGGVRTIARIVIHNRKSHSKRLNGFQLCASLDGRLWDVVHEDRPTPDRGPCLLVDLAAPVACKLLRVRLPGVQALHFIELEAYEEGV